MSSLLTDIKSPQLNADYAKNLSGVFNNIHNNFEQIVSLPYLAGAAGAPFESMEQSIWLSTSGDRKDWKLNEWGVRIVNAIFFDNDEKQQFKEEDVPSGIKAADIESHIEASVNASKYQKVEGISYTYAYENLFVNDTLYLYVTRDDSNEINNYYLGQYYHFADARLANKEGIGKVNWAFEDASCFLYYTPDKDNSLKGTFHKIYSLPVVYYDTTNEDWCWMFDNNKTGISCKGIQGDKGTDGAKFHMVRVNHTPSDQEQHTRTYSPPDSLYYNTVVSYAAMAKNTSLGNQEWRDVDDDFIKEVRNGDAAFAIISTKYNAETGKLDKEYKDIDITMCTLYKGVDNEKGVEKVVIKASYDRVNMFQQWDNHLKDGLKQIGVRGEDLEHWNRGLFVPAISFGDQAPEAYMIWADSASNTVHIGLVEDANVTQEANPVSKNGATIALDNNVSISGAATIKQTATIGGSLDVASDAVIKQNAQIGGDIKANGQIVAGDDVIAQKEVQIKEGLLMKGPIRNTSGSQYLELQYQDVNLRGNNNIKIQANQIWFLGKNITLDPYRNIQITNLEDSSTIEGLSIKNTLDMSQYSAITCGDNLCIIPGYGPSTITSAYDRMIKGGTTGVIKTINDTSTGTCTASLTLTAKKTASFEVSSDHRRGQDQSGVFGNRNWGTNFSYSLSTVKIKGGTVTTDFKLDTTKIQSAAQALINNYKNYSKGEVISIVITIDGKSWNASRTLPLTTTFKTKGEYTYTLGDNSGAQKQYVSVSASASDGYYNKSKLNDVYLNAYIQYNSSANKYPGQLLGIGATGTREKDSSGSKTIRITQMSNQYCEYSSGGKNNGYAYKNKTKQCEVNWAADVATSYSIKKQTIYDSNKTSQWTLNIPVTGIAKVSECTMGLALVNCSTTTKKSTTQKAEWSNEASTKILDNIINFDSTVTCTLRATIKYRTPTSSQSKVKIFHDQIVVEGSVLYNGSTKASVCRVTAAGLEVYNGSVGATYTLGNAIGGNNDEYNEKYNEMLKIAEPSLQEYSAKEITPNVN